jgi:fatty acid desaturase
MKPITNEHNQMDYFWLLGLCLAFAITYIIQKHWFYLAGALVMLGLALARKRLGR